MARYWSPIMLRLTRDFDAAALVDSLKKGGWRVERGRTATISGAVIDTQGREVLGAGLAAIEERSGKRAALSVWVVPQKLNQSKPRLLFTAGVRRGTDVSGVLAGRTGLRLSGEAGRAAEFVAERVPFDVESGGAKARITVETLRTRKRGGAGAARMTFDGASGGEKAGPAFEIARGARGVDGEIDDWPVELMGMLGLAAGPEPEARFASTGDMTAGEAAVEVLKRSYTNMARQEAGARLGLDGEYVHNMRVATRQMRAVLRMFAGAFEKEARVRLMVEIRWIANVLGAVRDLDVYIAAVPVYLEKLEAEPPDYRFYMKKLEEQLAGARKALLEALDGDRYAALKKRLEEFTAAPPFSQERDVLRRTAKKAVGALGKRVVKIARKARSDEDLHAVRIALKRLRYGVEFLRGLTPKRMGRLAETAAAFQDILGRHNDATVACRRVREAIKDRRMGGMQFLLLGYLLACQRLAAIDARLEFFRKWRGKSGRRLVNDFGRLLGKL